MSVRHRIFEITLVILTQVCIVQSLQHWKKFYAEHKDYIKVGKVNHPPLDPSTPIPEHCDPKKAKAAQAEKEKRRKAEDPHDEL